MPISRTGLDATMPGFWPKTPAKSKPDFTVPRHYAKALVETGDAESINRGKAIRMKKPRVDLPAEFAKSIVMIRDQSCRMGPSMMIACMNHEMAESVLNVKMPDGRLVGWRANHEGLAVAWPRESLS